ncbi:hypothetical protein AMAG_02350 [Allomyces macrogynus ATCC 38327]|uniref:LIM zinc-binding domain-containing protein n=1 Tax=Allomyces macrogynus (strain ATCC 38327) TaxID=578462 RepID=A0A0L0S2G5_ALLM3|nr:hypothetical protein AMAG_02350 [Allomyces macrogynus ATCC 38327]|eukprot:KNE56549.1 hypothetical protein AMAG_02350 [Allomyces macrogynus ATCC 38327]
MDLGLPLFKCRDCGRDVDDPTTHVCALAAPKQTAPVASRPPASSGRGYGSPPSVPRYDDYGSGRRNDRGGYGQDDYYGRDHRPNDRYDRQRDDRYQDDRYQNDRYEDERYSDRYGSDRRYDDHGGRERYDSHTDQYDRRYDNARQYDSGRRREERGNSHDSYERSAPSKDPYGTPNGGVPSQEGSDVGAPNAPTSSAAGAAKKGLDFLSLSVGKLFSGSNAPADTKPDPAPPKHTAAPTTDSAIDGMSRHLADTRLDSDDRYRRTPSPPPAVPNAPSAASTIPLSEIMLYKDAKSLTCTGACKGRIWKGEEIVLIGDDVLHAKCCVCAECGETAADDEYGSDGWISHEPGRIIACANCLEKAQPGDDDYHHKQQPPPPLPAPLPPPPAAAPEPDFPTCGTCRLSIMPGDQVVEHAKLPDMHHARCLDCAQCRRPLSATLSPTNPVHVRQGRPLCHPCYLQTLPRCGGCKNVITRDTRVVAALGRKYHPQCFGCVRCGKNFPDKSFYVLNNEPYDKWCYHEANGSLCGGCGHPIEGACACVVEGRFHPRCFCCAACGVALNDVYFAFEGRAFCEVHIADVQRRRGGGKAERRQTFFKQMS